MGFKKIMDILTNKLWNNPNSTSTSNALYRLICNGASVTISKTISKNGDNVVVKRELKISDGDNEIVHEEISNVNELLLEYDEAIFLARFLDKMEQI
jgi:hypothetical protein